MTKLLGNLNTAILIGLVFLFMIAVGLHRADIGAGYATPFMVFLHVLSGIVWIGLLYYFNLVQIPTMPKVPAELKGGVSKYIAPEALFWFRWGAVATLVTGLGVAGLKGYTAEAFTLQPGYRAIGLGMYFAIFMAANVWVIIWPNQQRALGLVPADDASKATSARIAMLGSRTNFILSIPMLYGMVTQNYLAA